MANIVGMESAGRVLPLFKGDYDNSRVYENPDIVLYKNSSFVALQTTVGNPPPEVSKNILRNDYWQCVAKGIIDADVSDATVEFTEASARENIQSGEDVKTLFGKIKKWYSSFSNVAFSGNVKDVTGAVATSKILTTKEQIDANTDTSNVAGAAAVKDIKAALTNDINQINSNLLEYRTVFSTGNGTNEIDLSPYFSEDITIWGAINGYYPAMIQAYVVGVDSLTKKILFNTGIPNEVPICIQLIYAINK